MVSCELIVLQYPEYLPLMMLAFFVPMLIALYQYRPTQLAVWQPEQ